MKTSWMTVVLWMAPLVLACGCEERGAWHPAEMELTTDGVLAARFARDVRVYGPVDRLPQEYKYVYFKSDGVRTEDGAAHPFRIAFSCAELAQALGPCVEQDAAGWSRIEHWALADGGDVRVDANRQVAERMDGRNQLVWTNGIEHLTRIFHSAPPLVHDQLYVEGTDEAGELWLSQVDVGTGATRWSVNLENDQR